MEVQESSPLQPSRWSDELLSLHHDALAESHGRDYRSLFIFPLGEFLSRNMRVRVFDISAMNKMTPAYGLMFSIQKVTLRTLESRLIFYLPKGI